MTYVLNFFNPTASATAYGQKPKVVMAEHSATAEGENCAYGPTLLKIPTNSMVSTKSAKNGISNKEKWLYSYLLLLVPCMHRGRLQPEPKFEGIWRRD